MITFEATTLTPTELDLRNEVRAFLAEYRSNNPAVGLGLNAASSREFSKQIARRGWVGMTIPVEEGGPGRSAVERFIVAEELLAAGAPIAGHWVADRQTSQIIQKFGSEALKEKFLPQILSGEAWFSLGMSEPDSGSDLASVRTRATRTTGGWLLNGQKVWTSGAQDSDYIITLCRTSPLEDRKHVGLSQLIVDLRSEGVTITPIKLLNGVEHFNEVYFDDVFVSDEMVLGKVGDGWAQVMSELAHERSGPDRFLSVMPVLSLLYEKLATTHLSSEIKTQLGEIYSTYITLRNMSLSIARALDKEELPNVEAALVKDLGTKFELEVINIIRDILDRDLEPATSDLDRLLADAIVTSPTFTLRGGTNEVLRTVIAKHLLRSRRTAA